MGLRRQVQLVGHCGPTCISMLLEHHGVQLSQAAIAAAAGVVPTISLVGSRIDQLAIAVDALAAQFVLLGRYNSGLEHIESILSLRMYAGVEWQGRFLFKNSHHQFDVGHYSLVTELNRARGILQIVDPDDKSVYSHGSIAIDEFLARWWEDNEMVKGSKRRSFGLVFVVVPRSRASEVESLGFEQVTYDFSMRSRIAL